jgi:hypothetical protein
VLPAAVADEGDHGFERLVAILKGGAAHKLDRAALARRESRAAE